MGVRVLNRRRDFLIGAFPRRHRAPTRRLITAADFFQACSEGLIGTREAMRDTGVNSPFDLLDAMVDCRWRQPCGRGREEVEREVAGAVPVLTRASGLAT